MPIYDNSPDTDIGFKATLSFVAAIAVFGFGTLLALALETPLGILFALTFGLLLAVLPFVVGWVAQNPIDEATEVMDMGGFGEMPLRRTEEDVDRPMPGEEPIRHVHDEHHP